MNREGYIKHKDVIEAWANGAEIEYYAPVKECWVLTRQPEWLSQTKYRIKATADSIDHTHLKDNWKWMARDKSGTVVVYEQKPIVDDGFWYYKDGESLAGIELLFTSYKRGTADWKDSLVELTHEVNT